MLLFGKFHKSIAYVVEVFVILTSSSSPQFHFLSDVLHLDSEDWLCTQSILHVQYKSRLCVDDASRFFEFITSQERNGTSTGLLGICESSL